MWEHDYQHQEQFILKMHIQKNKIKIKTHSVSMIYRENETIMLPLQAYLEPYQITAMTFFFAKITNG